MLKVGMRVRKVRLSSLHCFHPDAIPVGTEGVITAAKLASLDFRWAVNYDNHPGESIAADYMLAPLTDPKADEFIERIKKIAREPAIAPKVTA